MRTAWPTRPLGEICDIQIGKTPPRAQPRFWGGDRPWLSIRDMNQGRDLRETAEGITDAAVQEQNCRLVDAGTVLLSFKLSIGKVGIAQRPMYTNEAIAQLPITAPGVDRDYLYWALRTVPLTGDADRAAMGATLNKAKLNRIPIPLPPVEQQRRIAAVLDAADALRAKRRKALTELGTLAKAIFIDMFGHPLKNASGWEMKALAGLGRVQTGKTPPGKKEGMYGDAVPFITPGDLDSHGPVQRWLSREGAEHSRVVSPGSTLVCCIGATIGKVGQATEESAFNQQINAIDWDRETVVPAFGTYTMRFLSPEVAKQGASTTLPLLKKSSFQRLEIPTPPVHLQAQFSRVVDAVEAQKRLGMCHAVELDKLFASLQQLAFRGQL